MEAFSRRGWLPEVRPVGSHTRTHQGLHFRSVAATLENVEIDLARPGTGRIRRKISSRYLEPLRTDPTFTDEEIYEDEVDWQHPTTLCDLWELPTCFLDGLHLSEASPDPPHRFPPWREQTGSSCRRWFPVWRRRFLGSWLPEVRPVGSHPQVSRWGTWMQFMMHKTEKIHNIRY